MGLGRSLGSRDTLGLGEAEAIGLVWGDRMGPTSLPSCFSRLLLPVLLHLTPKVSFSKFSRCCKVPKVPFI